MNSMNTGPTVHTDNVLSILFFALLTCMRKQEDAIDKYSNANPLDRNNKNKQTIYLHEGFSERLELTFPRDQFTFTDWSTWHNSAV